MRSTYANLISLVQSFWLFLANVNLVMRFFSRTKSRIRQERSAFLKGMKFQKEAIYVQSSLKDPDHSLSAIKNNLRI